MKRINIENVKIQGGEINWREFADGFCDGFALGSLAMGNVKAIGRAVLIAAGISKGCDGIGWLL
jgi:hypothetical protein